MFPPRGPIPSRVAAILIGLTATVFTGPASAPAQIPPQHVPPAQAGDSPDPDPQALLAEGLAKRDAGDLRQAAALLRRSYDLEPTERAGINLASTLADMGRPLEATRVLRGILDHPEGDLLLMDVAQDLLEKTAVRVPRLRVVLVGDPLGWTVRVDDRRVSLEQGEREMELEPGVHRIVAASEGTDAVLERRVDLAEGELETVRLLLPTPPAEERVVTAGSPAASQAPGASSTTMPPPADRLDDEGTRRRRIWIWTAVGVGVAALAGVGIWALARDDGAPAAATGNVPTITIGGSP